MILYTPIPLELILAGSEDFRPTYEEVDIRGCKVLVERTDASHASIVRILSTNPADFLDPTLFPGAVVTFQVK
ncbi:MAG TPA: hypothetical protein GXX69_06850 [Firmicutes bacterium]|jgi:hypothetical protein|nr:hypothetical protein [Bacillota bacterium]